MLRGLYMAIMSKIKEHALKVPRHLSSSKSKTGAVIHMVNLSFGFGEWLVLANVQSQEPWPLHSTMGQP